MSGEMTQAEIVAMEAQQLLNNPTIKRAFESMRESLVISIENLPLTDDKMRDKLMLSLQLLKGLQQEFYNVIETGQISNWLNKQPNVE